MRAHRVLPGQPRSGRFAPSAARSPKCQVFDGHLHERRIYALDRRLGYDGGPRYDRSDTGWELRQMALAAPGKSYGDGISLLELADMSPVTKRRQSAYGTWRGAATG